MSPWDRVKREMPKVDAELPKTWGGFAGAAAAAAVASAIGLPFKLAGELAKAAAKPGKGDAEREARELLREAVGVSIGLPNPAEFANSVLRHFDLPEPLRAALFEAFRGLYAESVPREVPRPPADLESLAAVRWRAAMRARAALTADGGLVRMRQACAAAADAIVESLPKVVGQGELGARLQTLADSGKLVERMAEPLGAAFPAFGEQYAAASFRLSGLDPKRPKPNAKIAKPREFDDPSPFLEGTPLAGILPLSLPIELPQVARFSHHWIVAPPETGKTNAFRYLIGKDLERAARGECSLVVIDHQAQLIGEITRMKLFAPGRPLWDKLCLVDASDARHPVAMNFFDLGDSSDSKMTRSALEMYEFLLGSLLQQEMSPRQATMFRMVTLVMFAMDGADIETFHDFVLFEPSKKGEPHKYQEAIDRAPATVREYFATTYVTDPMAKQTREQVSARLWTLRSNDAFMRMFSAKKAKLRFSELVDAPGSVILVNTNKEDLGEQGCEMLGRFFLALVKQAAEARAARADKGKLTPCFCYVDECHNYVRDNEAVGTILAEARQQKIGLVLAHQHLSQLGKTVHALSGTAGIKMASNVSVDDRPKMARELETVPNFIAEQPQGSFALWIRFRMTKATSVRFPLDWFSRFDPMTPDEREAVLANNRRKYAKDGASEPKAKSPARKRRDPDAQ